MTYLNFGLKFRQRLDVFTIIYSATSQIQHNVCEQHWLVNITISTLRPLNFCWFGVVILQMTAKDIKNLKRTP